MIAGSADRKIQLSECNGKSHEIRWESNRLIFSNWRADDHRRCFATTQLALHWPAVRAYTFRSRRSSRMNPDRHALNFPGVSQTEIPPSAESATRPGNFFLPHRLMLPHFFRISDKIVTDVLNAAKQVIIPVNPRVLTCITHVQQGKCDVVG